MCKAGRALKAGAPGEPGGAGWGIQDRGTRAPVADSRQRVAKTSTALQSNQPPIKVNQLKKKE